MRIAIGLTGSSGAVYAVEFIKHCPGDKYLVASKWGKAVLHDEMGMQERELAPYVKKIFSNDDLHAPIASGSNHLDAFIVIPCTVSTLAKIASGIGAHDGFETVFKICEHLAANGRVKKTAGAGAMAGSYASV